LENSLQANKNLDAKILAKNVPKNIFLHLKIFTSLKLGKVKLANQKENHAKNMRAIVKILKNLELSPMPGLNSVNSQLRIKFELPYLG